jgi:glucose-6-phosphate 1-dehydrogenase
MTAPAPRTTVAARPSGSWHGFEGRTHADPCTMIILGAGGDLARRKLMPAIYQLAKEHLLAQDFAVVGVAREAIGDAGFRQAMRDALEKSDEIKGVDPEVWAWLEPRLFYVAGDFSTNEVYGSLRPCLESIESALPNVERNRIFYLAVPPSMFPTIIQHLSQSGLAPRIGDSHACPWVRVVVEKPFGHSLETARHLNALVLEAFSEHQVYRIDHYLGKETVQNVLVLRFGNSIFEPLWNRQWISHVQITAAETVGVETRGKYYEEAGVLRDMFQNHLIQLLTLTAMEPPGRMTAEAVRDEKVKVLRSVRWLTPDSIPQNAVRAQYAKGSQDDRVVPAYREEPNVNPKSVTPTYAAVRLFIDNWRWRNVPFYLRSGKRMAKRVSEIAVQFHRPPHLMFGGDKSTDMEPNVLVMRVQPNEGVNLRFQVKVPGAAVALTSDLERSPVDMDFAYSDAFGEKAAPAYQTLLLDVMIGEATLFTRSDEVEAAWQLVDPLISYWERNPPRQLPTYPAGTWGPADSEIFIAQDGFRWRTP